MDYDYKTKALAACDAAFQDCAAKAAMAFVTNYGQAQGKPDAEALIQQHSEIFRGSLKFHRQARESLIRLVNEAFSAT